MGLVEVCSLQQSLVHQLYQTVPCHFPFSSAQYKANYSQKRTTAGRIWHAHKAHETIKSHLFSPAEKNMKSWIYVQYKRLTPKDMEVEVTMDGVILRRSLLKKLNWARLCMESSVPVLYMIISLNKLHYPPWGCNSRALFDVIALAWDAVLEKLDPQRCTECERNKYGSMPCWFLLVVNKKIHKKDLTRVFMSTWVHV